MPSSLLSAPTLPLISIQSEWLKKLLRLHHKRRSRKLHHKRWKVESLKRRTHSSLKLEASKRLEMVERKMEKLAARWPRLEVKVERVEEKVATSWPRLEVMAERNKEVAARWPRLEVMVERNKEVAARWPKPRLAKLQENEQCEL